MYIYIYIDSLLVLRKRNTQSHMVKGHTGQHVGDPVDYLVHDAAVQITGKIVILEWLVSYLFKLLLSLLMRGWVGGWGGGNVM